MTDAYNLICADILEWCASYEGPQFHACLCDAPYHLTDTHTGSASPAATVGYFKAPRAKGRGGFMNMKWDGGDISYNPETWQAIAAHLLPGAFLFVYAGTMNDDLISLAMRKAGLEKSHSLAYIYGSGFPKATRVSDSPDFEGHRYGRQAIKPSHETILVFRKPYDGKPVDSIVETGAGALNVDAGRIGQGQDKTPVLLRRGDSVPAFTTASQVLGGDNHVGRWPASVCLSHLPGCRRVGDDGQFACVEGCPIRALDEQAGECVSRRADRGAGINGPTFQAPHYDSTIRGHNDQGGPSRYFHCADFAAETQERLAGLIVPGLYTAKASRSEREAGLHDFDQTTVTDGRQKPIDNAYQRGETRRRNRHPTVKPIELNRWLASLLLPPDVYAPRRLLVPFAGVASEMIGAFQAGWEVVTGIELMPEYVEIGKARLDYWLRVGYQMELFE